MRIYLHFGDGARSYRSVCESHHSHLENQFYRILRCASLWCGGGVACDVIFTNKLPLGQAVVCSPNQLLYKVVGALDEARLCILPVRFISSWYILLYFLMVWGLLAVCFTAVCSDGWLSTVIILLPYFQRVKHFECVPIVFVLNTLYCLKVKVPRLESFVTGDIARFFAES